MITSASPTAVPHLVQIRPRGASGRMGENIKKQFYLFIYLYLFSGTNLQVRPVDGFSRSMAQTTRTRARVCLLGFRWYCSPFWEWNPPKPQFLGVGKRFQAKREKYWNFHIIEITLSISIKFCEMIETTKYSSRVVRIRTPNKSKMADGRHFGKTAKWPHFRNRLTNFDEIWQGDAYWHLSADDR